MVFGEKISLQRRRRIAKKKTGCWHFGSSLFEFVVLSLWVCWSVVVFELVRNEQKIFRCVRKILVENDEKLWKSGYLRKKMKKVTKIKVQSLSKNY